MESKLAITLAVAMAMSGADDADEQALVTTTPTVAARTVTVATGGATTADHADCAPRGMFTAGTVGPPVAGTVVLGTAGTGTYGATYGAYGGGYGSGMTYGAVYGGNGGGTVKARRGLFGGRAGSGGGLFRGRLGRGGGGCGG